MSTEHILNGRYRMEDLIGRGGMADVYRGTDLRLKRTVAIKMMRPDLARDPQFQSRFRREATSSASLNHPNIVHVFDTGEEDIEDRHAHEVSCPFLVMEHVDGGTMKDAIGAGDVTVEEAVAWLDGVLAALSYSHGLGIVHRDIKPANVMVTGSGEVKVMDFGIARALADTSATMTQTQTVVGTAQYLSPEQAMGGTVGTRSDLYSVGCVAFELLTGRPPFLGESPVSVAYQHVRQDPPRPSTLNPDVTPALDAVVLTALAKEPDDRFDDADQFAAALVEALGSPEQTQTGALPLVDPDADAPAGPTPSEDSTPALPAAGAATGAGAAGAAAGSGAAGAAAGAAAVGSTAAGAAGASVDSGGHRPPLTPRSLSTVDTNRHLPVRADLPNTGSTAVGDAEEERSPRRRGLLFGLIALLLLAVAAAVALPLLLGGRDSQVEVPDVVGVPVEQAETTLTEAGLETRTSEVYDDEVPEGSVVSTDPGAGDRVDSGSEVRLKVSQGPSSVTLPESLRGASEATVRDELSRLGLTVSSVSSTNSADVPRDRLVSTSPELGSAVPPGSSVDLQLSTGRTTLPNVVGLSEESARTALQEAAPNVIVRVQERESAAATPGYVMRQDPPADREVDNEGAVTLTVAKAAPEPSETPSPSDDPEPSPSQSPTPSEDPTESPDPSPSPSQSPDPTDSPEPSESPSPSDDPEPSESPSPSEDPTESPEPSDSPPPSEDPTESPDPSPSPSQSPDPTNSPTPSESPSPTGSGSPSSPEGRPTRPGPPSDVPSNGPAPRD
ncbi:hypothetical protein HMPREF2863_01655 [Micrococcus sp. HMSC067E09]|uniref:Stk1 family PASTA domain-containing Ser/Thr kinase n=1 Tax=Micrococcus sp. HMSC067E09 TaxID=1739367 RepID=UPI0008A4F441|nr:Stk1 family PASTA domain-containing Ser/Thr kinase [Micrococcus sp. HMSC067E09]OFR87863.1 hypothetical protein HMPREF2863_01655 [Micrococcus sp. HMSC067E09]